MFRKCDKGFSLIEVIVTLNIWLLLCTSLLPPLIMVLKERKNIEILQTGNSILSDELQRIYFMEIVHPTEKMITRGKLQYNISVNEMDESQLMNVCIAWIDLYNREVERCGYIKNEN